MSSPERVYALLIEVNPIPDPRSVPPVPSPADERRSVMLTREPTPTKVIPAKNRWPRAIGALAATIVVVGAVVVAWVVVADGDGEPVASADARIEVTWTGDGTSYDGDREIIEGPAEVTFNNETGSRAWFVILRLDTGSEELAAELEFVREGDSVPMGDAEAPGLEFMETFAAGTHTVELTLEPGTYILDTGKDMAMVVNRAAVIEVVSD